MNYAIKKGNSGFQKRGYQPKGTLSKPPKCSNTSNGGQVNTSTSKVKK